jgi:hypothetical protein
MKSSSIKKIVRQALTLGSRKISIRNLPKLRLRDFDGWFTATRGVSTVSDVVSEWDNLVPGGANLTQSTANARPALTTVNGKTAIDFDGASGRAAASDFVTEGAMLDDIGTGDFYVGMVINCDSMPISTQTLITKANGTGNSQWQFLIQADTAGDDEVGVQLQHIQTSPSIVSTTLFLTSEILFVDKTTFIELVKTGDTIKVFSNGTLVITSSAQSKDFDADGDIKISQGSGSSPFNGVLCEFICKKGAMPDKTRQIIESLMAEKWNLNSARATSKRGRASGFNSLPAANRFRNKPPRF